MTVARLIAIPKLNSISFILLGVGAYESICVQMPYFMRGLIFGSANESGAFFILVGYGISEPFTQHLINWGTGIISCGFWYLLLTLLLMVMYTAIMLIIYAHKTLQKKKKERKSATK